MTDKDFDKVSRYLATRGQPLMEKSDDFGNWVKYEDYQELLAAYKELKWMYEELCK
jgi:hypothetical protein